MGTPPTQDIRVKELNEFYWRIANSKTLHEAQQAAFVLWYHMQDTSEGWQCRFCQLNCGVPPPSDGTSPPLFEQPAQLSLPL